MSELPSDRNTIAELRNQRAHTKTFPRVPYAECPQYLARDKIAAASIRSQLGQEDVVAASIGDRVAAEFRGSAAGSGEIQVALAVRLNRVGVVGAVTAGLLEPPQRSGSVILHDVDIRGRAAAAGVGRAVEFDAAAEGQGSSSGHGIAADQQSNCYVGGYANSNTSFGGQKTHHSTGHPLSGLQL